MTPAVKVRHPNHWTAREVLSFPSLFCPTLLLHRSPPVSLLSLSLSHTPNPLSTHTHHKSVSGKVSHLHRTWCTPVFVSQTARNGHYTPGSLLLVHPSPTPPPPTPVTLTSFLSVILALWDFSLHVHTCSLPLGVLSHLPCSPSRLFSPW